MPLTLTSTVRQKKHAIYKKIGTEVHVLNPDLGTICSLNETGSLLWEAMKKPITITKLSLLLSAHYDIDKKTAQQDVTGLVKKMLKAQIIEKAR